MGTFTLILWFVISDSDTFSAPFSILERETQITTNICINNLPRTLNEEELLSIFKKFGPIASVKVKRCTNLQMINNLFFR